MGEAGSGWLALLGEGARLPGWRARAAGPARARFGCRDEGAIAGLLVGRRVVAAAGGPDGGTLTLDDGTVLEVIPNEGCGGCGNGWYELVRVARVENVITRVGFEVVPGGAGRRAYRVFVFAGDERFDLLEVAGDDGNGYYGTGYEVWVRA